MSLPSLFLKETSEGDVSQTKLPQDMDLWAETITAKIRERLPMSRHMIIKISFLNKNEELGTATGSAMLHDQKLNKAVYLPLIVKNFSLYPMDVMMVPKKDTEGGFEVCPLHKDIFAQAMFNSDVFEHLERPMDRIQQMYMNPQSTIVYPPYTRNVYASASGVIGAISDTITQDEKDSFIQHFKDNPNDLIGYEKRANLDVIKKIAASEIKITAESVNTMKNITLLQKKNNKDLNVITASDEVFDPIIESRDNGLSYVGGDEQETLTEETLNEVRQNGEKIVFKDLTPKDDVMLGPLNSPDHYTDIDDKVSETQIFGAYKVQDKNGVFHKGIVIPNVIDFNMKKVNGKVFKSLNKSSYQDKIVGIPTGAEKMQFLKFKEPAIGMTGVFVTYTDTNALATIPVTIRSIYEMNGDNHIVAIDMNGRKVKIKYGGYIPEKSEPDFEESGLRNIAKVKDYYVVPRRFKFMAMDNFCQLMETSEKMSMKIASMSMSLQPVRVIHTGGSQFSLKGPDMTKMAKMCGWDSTNLEASQAVFLLTAKKCPITKVAQALKTAGSHLGEIAIHGLPATKFHVEHSELEVKIAQAAFEQIEDLKINLNKEAAAMDDAQVVDTSLSLNFINPNNVDKFIGFIPLFEQSSKALAQALLASRLGVNEIPENAAATAMHKLVEVIVGLNKLKTLEEKTAAKVGGLKKLLQDHAGTAAIVSGATGIYIGNKYSKKKNYKRGFSAGAEAMNNYMNTRLGQVSKTASFFESMMEGSNRVTTTDKKGKKKTESVKSLARRAYKKVHGKNYGDK